MLSFSSVIAFYRIIIPVKAQIRQPKTIQAYYSTSLSKLEELSGIFYGLKTK